MTIESAPRSNTALVMIFLRQVFYLQQLRLVLAAVLLNLLLILILLSMFIYFLKHPVHPIYFSTDKVGRIMVEPPLNQPNMPLENVSAWVVHAAQTAYSYDFINYRSQLQGAQKYFTDFGWRQYMKGLQSSNNLLALTEHKMIVIAKVVAPPKLLIQGILGQRYAWKFEMPVLVTYYESPYDDKSKFSNPLIVTVVVERQKLSESDHGLGIVQIIATLAIGTQIQEMNIPGDKMQATPKAEKEALMMEAQTAHFRDDFYRDGFRLVLLSLGMIIAAIGLLIIVSLYFFLHQVLPITFPVYEDWRVQADVPVDRPYLHIAELLQWTSTVLPQALAVDFINYNMELQEAEQYFTPNGWAKFIAFINIYMGHDEVLKNKVFVKATPSGAPVVLNQGVLDGKYGWWVQMPMDVRYSGVEGNDHNTKVVIQVLVVRVPTLNNLDGVAIDNLIAKQG